MTRSPSSTAPRLALLVLPVLLVALLACARIGRPEGWSGAAIAGDALFTGTDEGELLALNRGTGETLWRFSLRGEEEDRAIYGTPAVAGDVIYVGGYDAILYALTLQGEDLWQERLAGPIVGGPVVADGVVVVGSEVDDPPDGRGGTMYAFHTADGERIWRFPTPGKVWSTPAVANDTVYFGSLDHHVYALTLAQGEKVWDFETKGAVTAMPVVADGRVYVGSFDGVFYAIDAATGLEAWRFDGANNWYWTSALVAEGTVYAPSLDGAMYALDASSGELRWKLDTEEPIVGSPVIVHDSVIAVPSNDGKLRLASLRNGTTQDFCNVDSEIRTSLVEQDGVVYFGARDHSIRAVTVQTNGNPDEEWVHFTDRDDPLARDRARAC